MAREEPDASPDEPFRGRGVRLSLARLRTPIGIVQITASAEAVLYIDLPGREPGRLDDAAVLRRFVSRARLPVLRAAIDQLQEYFRGRRREFTVPLAPAGTEFQRRVWAAITAIPFGKTLSYGQLAEMLGGPHLARAVGAATGANPIPILIPCHRVVGTDGALTGYRGGLEMKVRLLQHEGALLA